jgi:tyrosyl-tRNA synthetase
VSQEAIDPEIAREVDRQLAELGVNAVDFYGRDELRERLAEALAAGRSLRVKLGLDPSAPDLHVGHTVVLHKLKTFQELGHTPIFLVGDFTASIGDPSGRSKTRPPLAPEQIQENAATYVAQVARVLDVERVEVRFNSEWMNGMGPADFVRLCAHGTVARLLERDDFAKRYAEGSPIFAHELLYPFVQAYDSVALEADVELGGTDQTFNMLMAREVQRDYGQPAQAVITHPLLVGTDGHEKMSKSLGNYVGITEPPHEIFGKVMSISDAALIDYVEYLGNREWDDLISARDAIRQGGGDPMGLKKAVAERLVARYHGDEAGREALGHFQRVVQSKGLPEDIPEHYVALDGAADRPLLELLEQGDLIESRGEARRLARQGALSIDGEKIEDPTGSLGPGSYLVRMGKRRFARITLA